MEKRTCLNSTHLAKSDESISFVIALKFKSNLLLTYILIALTFGLLYLLLIRNSPGLYIYFMLEECEAKYAEMFAVQTRKTFLIKANKGNNLKYFYDNTKKFSKNSFNSSSFISQEFFNSKDEYIYFEYFNNKYVFLDKENIFASVNFDLSKFKNKQIYEKFSKGIKKFKEYNYLRNKFGLNQNPLIKFNHIKYFLKRISGVSIFYLVRFPN